MMIWVVVFLLGIGLFLSAFFSGSETGFYRVTRVRLLLDGLDGDVVSRGLLRLTNNPALFVATTLIGNNLANYIVSLGIVLGVGMLFQNAHLAELIAPLAISPVIFVYCELLPKQLFFGAPNRLLRLGGPILLLCTVLFAPLAAFLWLLGRVLERLLGQTPLRIRLTLARKELQQVLREGQEAGVLQAAQHDLAQRLFANAGQNVLRFSTPISRVAAIPLGTDTATALRLAHRQQTSVVPVRAPNDKRLVGYVLAVDLRLATSETVDEVRPLVRISKDQSHVNALLLMQANKADLACVEGPNGEPIALLYANRLTDPLFGVA